MTGASGNDTAQPSMPLATAVQTPLLPVSSPGTRVTSQGFSFDWLGNTATATDDQSAFYERSLGTITNTGGGPDQLLGASQSGRNLSASYDTAGNLTSLSMTLGSTCTSDCTRTFSYAWDEMKGSLGQSCRMRGAGTMAPERSFATPRMRTPRTSTTRMGSAFCAQRTTRRTARCTTPRSSPSGSRGYSGRERATSTTTPSRWPTFTLGGASYGRVYATAQRFILGRLPAIRWIQHVSLEVGDRLGSTAAVWDLGTGTLQERTTFYPTGGVESDYQSSFDAGSNDDWEPYKFTGKETDNEFGFVYFGARYYSPQLGRWMSADPAWIQGLQGRPQPVRLRAWMMVTTQKPTLSGLQQDGDPTKPDPRPR